MTHDERREQRRVIAEYVRARGSDGSALVAACRKFGASATKVRVACAEFEVPLAGRDRSLERTLRIVADLADATDTYDAISRRHGVSRQRVSEVYRAARAAGLPVPVRKRGRPRS